MKGLSRSHLQQYFLRSVKLLQFPLQGWQIRIPKESFIYNEALVKAHFIVQKQEERTNEKQIVIRPFP
jgi:hypothetical protein